MLENENKLFFLSVLFTDLSRDVKLTKSATDLPSAHQFVEDGAVKNIKLILYKNNTED